MPAKSDLIALFRAVKGWERFATIHCNAISVPNDLSYPFDRLFACRDAGDFITLEQEFPSNDRVQFYLQTVMLGNERWAYISSNGHVIVPPFAWCPVFDEWADLLERAFI